MLDFAANMYFPNNFLQEQKQLGKTDLYCFFFQGVLKLVRNLVPCLCNTRPQTLSPSHTPLLTNINNIAWIRERTFNGLFKNLQSYNTKTTPPHLSVWIQKHVTPQLQWNSTYYINPLQSFTLIYSSLIIILLCTFLKSMYFVFPLGFSQTKPTPQPCFHSVFYSIILVYTIQ